jgi:hypothetical protein
MSFPNYIDDKNTFTLSKTYGLTPLDPSKYDAYDDTGNYRGYRIATKADHTCIYVRVDKNLLS